MQSFNHTFEEFPEGSWWIAWIDHVQSGAGQSPRVHVTLSRISRQGMSTSDLRTKIIETQNVLMTVSGLPLFAVGDIIENKRLVRVGNTSHVKSICDFGSGGVTASFTFNAQTVSQIAGTRLGDERAVRPTSYRPGFSCPVLSTNEYKFPATRNCLCLVVTDGPRTFLIPAAELLRSLVMPFSEPLGKLFDGPLPSVVDEMVERPSQSCSKQRPFRLELSEGYDQRHAPYVANLLAGYNATGARAAACIHHSLSTPDSNLARTYKYFKPTSVPEGCSLLPCVFPFGSGPISMEARCFALTEKRFLVAKITGGSWPFLQSLAVSVLRREVDPSQLPLPPPGQTKGGGRRDLRPGDPAETNLGGTPGYGRDPVELAAEPLHWRGQPSMTVQTRTRRSAKAQQRGVPDQQTRTGVAVGEHHPGSDFAPATASHVAGSVVDRFAETDVMLKRLLAAGKIVAVEPVLPANARHSATRGPLPVWIWPDRKGWHILKSASGPPRFRSILVLRVEVVPGRFVHWFLVEPSDTKSFAALLVALNDPHSQAIVTKIVDQISKRSGTITAPVGFARANGGSDGAKFNHTLQGAPPGSGGGPQRGKQLSDTRALSILKGLCL